MRQHFRVNLVGNTRNRQVYHVISPNRAGNSNRAVSMECSRYRNIPINDKVSKAVYKNLNSSRQEIRLLRVHPSIDSSASLSCTLLHTDLNPDSNSTFPAYEALSYVWGQPDLSRLISLNGHPFYITPSLNYALTSLRQRHKARVLWVDAICINQLNNEERGHQVALMRHIYSNSKRDIAWLDPIVTVSPGEKSVYTAQSILEAEQRVKEGMDLMNTFVQNGQKLKATQDRYRSLYTHTKEEQMLAAVFENPTLWSRLWVMQELSLAPRVTLVCGRAELEWSSLAFFFEDEPYIGAFHTDYPTHSASYYKTFSKVFLPAKRIEDQRRISNGDKKRTSSLIDVLTRFRAMESTDPRDKIYGLLGLVTPDSGIEVDYTQSLVEVYKKTTLSLINQSRNLDIICQNPFELWGGPKALRPSGAGALPSWVAEFDAKSDACVPVLFAQRDIFAAGAERCETPCRVLGPEQDILALRGVKLGTVGPILQKRVLVSQRPDKQDVSEDHLRSGTWNALIRGQDREAGHLMKMYLGEEAVRNPGSRLYEPKLGGDNIHRPRDLNDRFSTAKSHNEHSQSRETAFCAFLRTILRDCTHPPGIRRLRDSEIASLQVHNRDYDSQGFIEGLKNYKIRDNWRLSRSAFSHDLETEDEMQLSYVGYAPYNRDLIFTMTDNGVFLLVRPHAQQGDIVVVVDGAKVPMILRKAELNLHEQFGTNVFRIVCSAYVHGFMDGEAEVRADEERLLKQDIFIV